MLTDEAPAGGHVQQVDRFVHTLRVTALALLLAGATGVALAQETTPLPESVVAALDAELSGESAMRNLELISRQHRMRASRQFRAAAEHVAAQLREYGLDQVEILQFPADGETFFGTQKSRPAWDVEFAELWELRDGQAALRLASWESMPLTLAQDSESADVTAELVDVGDGTSESDYAGKDVSGKLVLTSQQPERVVPLAVERFGAAGVISYAQNQKTAWWKENPNLIRWGHLDSFTETETFGFMISLKRAREFSRRLAAGETIRLHAVVKAERHSGFYDIVTAVIPGADAELRKEEIAFSCHLDHPRPGANDNASGCAAILEAARSLAKLIREGKIAAPARTLRFVWPPEIEGTTVLLNARPDLARAIKAAIHMDMVGGGVETGAVFHVTRAPTSRPSFVNDIAEEIARFVNQQSDAFAAGADPPYPLVAAEGSKRALQAELVDFTSGSDHIVFSEGSFRIPSIYLNDWPDRYIHTNLDVAANIDPTKLKRAGFIGASSGYYLATLGPEQIEPLLALLARQSLRRAARMQERRSGLSPDEADNLTRIHWDYEHALIDSIESFTPVPDKLAAAAHTYLDDLSRLIGNGGAAPPASDEARVIFRRNPEVKGPMSVFGYDYFIDHYGVEAAASIRLSGYSPPRGPGGSYTLEVLNFVDGKRTVQQIRDAVSAEFGPVPTEVVLEYLNALASIEVIISR
jgi:aminopeptidase YwaD